MKKVLLIIIDGWGISSDNKSSAIFYAKTPFIDSCYRKYSNTKIEASGLSVGLPKGQVGNSEVGHINLGSGRIFLQNLVKINEEIKKNFFYTSSTLQKSFQYSKINNKKIHIIGLLSDGGVHSHINHLFALLDSLNSFNKFDLKNIFIHIFTDGRDTKPNSAKFFIKKLIKYLKKSTAKLATIIGRYYAMDRNNKWDRIEKAYNLIIRGIGEKSINPIKSIENFYKKGITDEFLKPIVIVDNKGEPISKISTGDVVISFNFRTDRIRQITEAFTQVDIGKNMKKLNLYYLTMTNYNKNYKNIKVLFKEENLIDTIGEVLEKNNKKQIRIAETEKYPHVTFFFSGGREEPFKNEKRILCQSPKVSTYDLKPEMSAIKICYKIIPEINKKKADFICLNLANPDMVGHTGIMKSAIKACEVVDNCAEIICKSALNNNYAIIMLSDHGNVEKMINLDGSPNTSHTTNEVPCFFIHNKYFPLLKKGKLCDIAPTILECMNIKKPDLMTGISLFN